MHGRLDLMTIPDAQSDSWLISGNRTVANPRIRDSGPAGVFRTEKGDPIGT